MSKSPSVSALPSASVQAYVLTNLRTAILSGALEPGHHLVERELKQLYGASRSSIREALRQLIAEGLVTAVPNLGSVVTRLTLEQVEQLYEVRIELENLAGRLFVLRADPSSRAALLGALDAIERAAAKQRPIIDKHDAFHEVLYAGGGSAPLHASAMSLRSRTRYLVSLSLGRPYHAERSIAALRAIVDGVVANDPQATGRACARHATIECAAALMVLSVLPGPVTSSSGPAAAVAPARSAATVGRAGRA